MSTVIIQDLPVFIDSETSEFFTIDSQFLLSLFDELEDKPNDLNPSISVELNPDGTPYAYALVTFENLEQAVQAISTINYTKLNGTPIHMKLYDSQPSPPLHNGENKILIKGMPQDITVSDLEYSMSDYGEVIDCKIPTYANKPLSYAIVQFREAETARRAVEELDGALFNGCQVEVVEFIDNKVIETEELNKKFRELLANSPTNASLQLLSIPDANVEGGGSAVWSASRCPPQSECLSFSQYAEHAVAVYEGGNAFLVSSRERFRANNMDIPLFESWTAVSIQKAEGVCFERFKSAVCCSDYALYLCCRTENVENDFLAISGFGLNEEMKAFCYPGVNITPVALFGGQKMCGSINRNGSVTIVNKRHFFRPKVLQGEVFVQLACGNKRTIALSKSGHLYEAKTRKPDDCCFTRIQEVANVIFVHVSGTCDHFLAVDTDGCVWARGGNEHGQLGIGWGQRFAHQFAAVGKFADEKIVSAFAGADHSLFVGESGAVYACGSNARGQLLVGKERGEQEYARPILTTITRGATFCIAGDGLSSVFMLSRPPSGVPNTRVEIFDGNDNEDGGIFDDNDNENGEIFDDNDNEDGGIFDDNDNEDGGIFDGNDNEEEEDDGSDALVGPTREKKRGNVEASAVDTQIASIQAEVSLIEEILRTENHRIEQFASNNQRMNSAIDKLSENIDAFLSANACTSKEGDSSSSCTSEEDDNSNASTGIEEDESESSAHDAATNDEDYDDESVKKIVFSDGSVSLNDLSAQNWPAGTTKYVEFFPGSLVPVTVVDISDEQRLRSSLDDLVDGDLISADFEWHPDKKGTRNPISVFQFCSSRGVLVVLNSESVTLNGPFFTSHKQFESACPGGLSIMKKFLSSNRFFAKGTGNDRKKLLQMFGQQFDIVDIERALLKPNHYTLNFARLVEELCGTPAAPIKDKVLTKSDWNRRPLSAAQVVYAAFDAYATMLFWKHFEDKKKK